jgi:hypothetical protein
MERLIEKQAQEMTCVAREMTDAARELRRAVDRLAELYQFSNRPSALTELLGFGGPAWIDWCSRVQGFLRIVLRFSETGIAAAAYFYFLFSWNEFHIAQSFLHGQSVVTLPVGVQLFLQQFSTDSWRSPL